MVRVDGVTGQADDVAVVGLGAEEQLEDGQVPDLGRLVARLGQPVRVAPRVPRPVNVYVRRLRPVVSCFSVSRPSAASRTGSA